MALQLDGLPQQPSHPETRGLSKSSSRNRGAQGRDAPGDSQDPPSSVSSTGQRFPGPGPPPRYEGRPGAQEGGAHVTWKNMDLQQGFSNKYASELPGGLVKRQFG